MTNKVGLFIEQNNKLIISPQMYQAIEMIQLSLPELIDYINNELVENPLLEVVEDDSKNNYEEEQREKVRNKEAKEDKWLDSIVDELLSGEAENWSVSNQKKDEIITVEGCWFDNNNLQEYLLEQLRFIRHRSKLSEQEYAAAEYIIGNLDSNGYLTVEIVEIAQALDISQEEALQGLRIVQKLDPLGVGARTLQECLKLQFSLIPDCPPEMEFILDYLDELAAGHLKKIASALRISPDEVRILGELIKLLDPKPGSRFDQMVDIRYIIPDAVIKKIGEEYVVLVNENDIPRISVNEGYKKVLQQQDNNDIKKFLKEKLNSAFNLIKSIEHRRSTIYDVLEAVVKKQKDFLDQGFSALKPLTMREIAEELGIHESTVSRVSANKYVQTPRGLCSIKCFFAGSVGGEREVTPGRIKDDIKKYISEENILKPYSDQDLADLFEKDGIEIARRTVAKYREELRIPSSSLRKKSKYKE